MVTRYYNQRLYVKNDFIGGTVASYEEHFLTGAPPQSKNYLTLMKPFEPHVWVFILASALATSIALIFINKMHATWSNEPLNESAFQSKYKWQI